MPLVLSGQVFLVIPALQLLAFAGLLIAVLVKHPSIRRNAFVCFLIVALILASGFVGCYLMLGFVRHFN